MSKNTIDTLNNLIETCNDGMKGFELAAKDVERADLRVIMNEGASRCRDAGLELATLVRGLGGEPAEGGSAAGALHRGWVEIKSAVSTRTDLAVMEECERGEDAAKASYKRALENTELPADIRLVIQRQYTGVIENHDRVKALRDSLKAVAHA